MGQAGFEGLEGFAGASGAFGEEDEGVAFVEGFEAGLEWVYLPSLPIEEDAVEDVVHEVAAEFRFVPVIGGGYGADVLAEVRREGGVEEEEVEVACVIGEVDALGVGGVAAEPTRRCARE